MLKDDADVTTFYNYWLTGAFNLLVQYHMNKYIEYTRVADALNYRGIKTRNGKNV